MSLNMRCPATTVCNTEVIFLLQPSQLLSAPDPVRSIPCLPSPCPSEPPAQAVIVLPGDDAVIILSSCLSIHATPYPTFVHLPPRMSFPAETNFLRWLDLIGTYSPSLVLVSLAFTTTQGHLEPVSAQVTPGQSSV